MCTVREWVVVVPPLVVVVEVGVRGLVVERQVGGAGEPRQRHVRLPGAFLKERRKKALKLALLICNQVHRKTVQIILGLLCVQRQMGLGGKGTQTALSIRHAGSAL